MIDVVMLSITKDKKSFLMTQKAIDSLHNSESSHKFRVFLIETNKDYVTQVGNIYNNATVITPPEEFNYNYYLNLGLSLCKSENIVIANNDLIFTDNWYDILHRYMLILNLHSASPGDPKYKKHKNLSEGCLVGDKVGKHFCGWCFVIKKEILDNILPLDERFKFWCQDNDMVNCLKEAIPNYKHGLITQSKVYHLNGRSHKYIKKDKILAYTKDMCELHDNKWK